MTKQRIEIEVDVPDGWIIEAIRDIRKGETYLARRDGLWVIDTALQHWPDSYTPILRRVEPKRESRWLNVYRTHEYELLEGANRGAGSHRAACIRIDYENGQPVRVELEPVAPEAEGR